MFEHIYDLQNKPLWNKHIDKGESTAIYDMPGKPVESHDAKGAMSLSAYDTLSRPTNAWARNKTGDDITLRGFLVYGDSASLTDPEDENLKGKLYQGYDEAGMQQMSSYDFKGNLLEKFRSVIDSSVLKAQLDSYQTFIVDWTGLPSILDSVQYTTTMEYDALNRVTLLTLPENVDSDRKDIVPQYNRAGTLASVTYDGDIYVENICYNARGQRTLIAYGNAVMTRYVYDPLTFKLLRYRSEKYTKSQVDQTVTYAYDSGTVRQDDGFNTDLIGNIVKILTRVTDCGISGSLLGSDALDRDFVYDSMYRLTSATGRESDTQNANDYLYDDAPAPASPNANHVRTYGRTYSYDKIGNVQSVVQSGTNGFTRNFSYNTGVNSLFKIRDAGGTGIEDYTYDANSNQLTAGGTRNYVWDHGDRLICYYNQAGSSDPTVYTQYDYSGHDRVSKLVRTGTAMSPVYERTIYIDGVFEYCILENGTTYEKNYVHITDGGTQIAEVRVGDQFPGDISDDVVYVLGDQIGSSTARLSDTGAFIDKEEYYPFGDSSLRTFAYKRYRYVGKERDQESGLYYYGARYYAAWTCRFISVDPLASKYAQLSPYNYADNNPINDFDIDGMQNNNSGTTPSQGNTGQNNALPSIDKNVNSQRDNVGSNVIPVLKDKTTGAYYLNKESAKIANENAGREKNTQYLSPGPPPLTPKDPGYYDGKNGRPYNPELMAWLQKNLEREKNPSMSFWINLFYVSQTATDAAAPFVAAKTLQGNNFSNQTTTAVKPKTEVSGGVKQPIDGNRGATFVYGETPANNQGKQFITLTSAEDVKGGGFYINEHYQGKTNCAGCAIAGDGKFKGRPSVALDHPVTALRDVMKDLGVEQAEMHYSIKKITEIMLKLGDGSTAVVLGSITPDKGHYFNVRNDKGVITFLDFQRFDRSQLMIPTDFTQYNQYFLMNTTGK